jgi:hypothetical protein
VPQVGQNLAFVERIFSPQLGQNVDFLAVNVAGVVDAFEGVNSSVWG